MAQEQGGQSSRTASGWPGTMSTTYTETHDAYHQHTRKNSPDVILCGWLGSKHQLTNTQKVWKNVFLMWHYKTTCQFLPQQSNYPLKTVTKTILQSFHLFSILSLSQVTRIYSKTPVGVHESNDTIYHKIFTQAEHSHHQNINSVNNKRTSTVTKNTST